MFVVDWDGAAVVSGFYWGLEVGGGSLFGIDPFCACIDGIL